MRMQMKADFVKAEKERIQHLLNDPIMDDIVSIINQWITDHWFGKDGESVLNTSIEWAINHNIHDLQYTISLDQFHYQSEQYYHKSFLIKETIHGYFMHYWFGLFPSPFQYLRYRKIAGYLDQIISPFNDNELQRLWFDAVIQKSEILEQLKRIFKKKGFQCEMKRGLYSTNVKINIT